MSGIYGSKTELCDALERAIQSRHVPGASVAVLSGNQIITATAGVANIVTRVPMTDDTIMHIGSITKLFTATLIMQLVDEGNLELDRPVLAYLPKLRSRDQSALEQVTVRMLLNHSSGLDGAWLPDRGHDEETIEKTVNRVKNLGQIFPPGTDYSYNNVAYVIAGHLAQTVAGKSWHALITERIFRPLGMDHAVTLPEEAILYRASVGHYQKPGSSSENIRTSRAFLGLGFAPAGSTLMMSSGDLLKFASAHINDGVGPSGVRILSVESARLMQQITVSFDGRAYTYGDGIGLGWQVFHSGILMHGGGGPGVSCILFVNPVSKRAIAVLTNAKPHGSLLYSDITSPWLADVAVVPGYWVADVDLKPTSEAIDPARYTGVYENIQFRYRVTASAEGLQVSEQLRMANHETQTVNEGPPVRLIPLGKNRFARDVDDDFHRHFSATRIIEFRNPAANGQTQHAGVTSMLARRVSS